MEPAKQQWFSDVFEAGLTHQFYKPDDVVAVATPPVLAEHLPREVMASVLTVAMQAKLTPEQVISTVSARTMSEHVPDAVLWKCIAGAADKTGISNGGAAKDREPQVRKFLREALESGLRNKVLRPDDVVRHIEARVLVDALPHELTAKLLAVGLKGGTIDAALVIEVIGVAALAEHAPTTLLWQCVQEIQTGTPSPSPAPKRASPPSGETAKAQPKPKPPAKPKADPKPTPQARSAGLPTDFHEAETDVRDPMARHAETDLDDDVLEIVEEPVAAQAAASEKEDKKSSKRGGIFGRRKR